MRHVLSLIQIMMVDQSQLRNVWMIDILDAASDFSQSNILR